MTPLDSSVNEPVTLSEGLLRRLTTEVRQTLHHVLGSIELISEQPLSRPQLGQLSRCGESLHELLRLANDVSELVDYSSTGERSCQFTFPELLEEFSDLLGARAAKKGLELRWTVDRGIPTVIGYRNAIEAVLYRLVDNSIEFTQHGGITISVKMTHRDQQFGEIAIEVGDTGPGLHQSVVDDLERPISESQAVGLGLRLARKQLAAVGGRLEVVSCDDRGATLAIVFPVTIPAEDLLSEPASLDDTRNVLLRLLVAEDSDDSFAVFESFVQDEGHEVTRAVNGAEALDMFKRGTFDMVIMDVNMPVMDGYTTTRAIRDWETQQGRARSPILLLSADDAGRQKRIGSAVGCSGYLTKPTPKRELLCALKAYSPAASTFGSTDQAG